MCLILYCIGSQFVLKAAACNAFLCKKLNTLLGALHCDALAMAGKALPLFCGRDTSPLRFVDRVKSCGAWQIGLVDDDWVDDVESF